MSQADSNHTEIITLSEQNNTGLIAPGDSLPAKLYIVPIANRPFFPAQVMPVLLAAEQWEETLRRVEKTPHKSLALFFVENHDETQNGLNTEDLPETGTLVKVHQLKSDGKHIQFIAEGIKRVRVAGWLSRKSPYLAEVNYPQHRKESDNEIKAYAMALINAIKELLPINPLYSEELKHYLNRFSPNEPSPLADFAAAITTARGGELQEVLDTINLMPRMEKVLALLKKEINVARLHGELTDEVNKKVSKHQREFFLREQLKLIQKELGITKDDKTSDAEEFRNRLDGKTVPEEALKKINEELKKLEMLETGSPEYGVTRNYLDWATSIPWGIQGEDNLNLKQARTTLNRDHEGLDDVKARILEFLAVGAFKGEISGSILLLVGPPGVGKTSIGKSVADALGRPFYRFSLGGMRDEAEIKGHRRTYIGALPGKFVQALKDVKVMNPVIMLDEIDKLGASYQGDPASALLETLDPEQNSQFMDHYLDMRLDLSKVLFICTANQLDTIPAPLLDRMDVIRLSGYLTEEKVAIAAKHLWPRQLQKAGVKGRQLKISRKALRDTVECYARESGVRNLEKQLAKIVRKGVVQLLEQPDESITVTPENLSSFLGNPIFRPEALMQGIGVITGLAWTAMGGTTLPIEATRIHTLNRGFKLTGKLGEVMRESAEIAYSYVCSNLEKYGADKSFFDKAFVHLHVPEGATPKDGPSAGVTMASALLSLALNKKPKANYAMTGELTLTGKVLAIGGVREKIIAAKRQNIKNIILPEANRGDYEEVPEYLRKGLKISFAEHYDDVFNKLFG
ncbi:endopeptidase La [Gynuella sunshinyii]|uniref:Lon protease n=1 Tax=Gynuella sunshinyii YC6258 TaxID=1445510 RepID=A0A0C5VNV6_9GAMM|nr:endopeptidase La [Gynuella sunshinyii]AJQ95991.1 ATP-dependent Lon protease, bacterial type [Gynuella sunshinyii YC6258]